MGSIPRTAGEPCPYGSIADDVSPLLQGFGPERFMRGSDSPWLDDWDSCGRFLSWVDEADYLSYLSYRTLDELLG